MCVRLHLLLYRKHNGDYSRQHSTLYDKFCIFIATFELKTAEFVHTFHENVRNKKQHSLASVMETQCVFCEAVTLTHDGDQMQ
jgi:hypothetical protein